MSTYCERCKMQIVDAHDPNAKCPVEDCPFNVREDRFHIAGEIAKLRLFPGDLLVIKIDGNITQEVAARVKAKFENLIPDGVKCAVIDGSITLSIVTVTVDDPLGLTAQ